MQVHWMKRGHMEQLCYTAQREKYACVLRPVRCSVFRIRGKGKGTGKRRQQILQKNSGQADPGNGGQSNPGKTDSQASAAA